MKTKPLTLATLAAALFCVSFSTASATNKPIPGIDIVVLKEPDGKAFKATTGMDGTFTIANLPAGTYVLSVNPASTGPAEAPVNTTRSNKKQSGEVKLAGDPAVTNAAEAPISTSRSNKKHAFKVDTTDTGAKVTITEGPTLPDHANAKALPQTQIIVLTRDGQSISGEVILIGDLSQKGILLPAVETDPTVSKK